MIQVLVLFTCFNRREKTQACIRSLVDGEPECRFSFVAADAGSTDGTQQMLRQLQQPVTILTGEGLYYSGGMRLAMEQAQKSGPEDMDYVLLINDDGLWNPGSIARLAEQSRRQGDAVIVGAMQDSAGRLSYGAIRYTAGFRYRRLSVRESELPADSFNANCVLIPARRFLEAPVMDAHYVHSLGDFDYGLTLKKCGCKIYSSAFYVGICDNNPTEGTWLDPSLPVGKRLALKESPKGAPAKQWFYFLRKNFGLPRAIWGTVTPYIRILLRK